ncbi:pyrimidodiazepine synthase-like [Clavelina lepadiformis]|uniref:pyrimidodiazepine synthase-like n=1 Tax=Clavelina lepadiformis TaxID=159417 RepID=UPI004042E545
MACETLTFYNHLWCPKSQSIHLALKASKVPHKTIEVPANGKDHVCSESERSEPALETKDQKSRNYREVIEFLQLIAKDPLKRSKQERILQHFVHHILPYFEKSVILSSPREGLDLFIEALSFIENELISSCGKYFGGSHPGVVDYGLFPYLDKIGKWIPAFEPNECPRVQSWVKSMRQHPLVTNVLSQDDAVEHLKSYSQSLNSS